MTTTDNAMVSLTLHTLRVQASTGHITHIFHNNMRAPWPAGKINGVAWYILVLPYHSMCLPPSRGLVLFYLFIVQNV